ncbi:autotransporter secretion outer membrane protein TamA [Thiohalospira halophila DSM 15071]|uniref:Translocation and assembly module subunit TamA n=1 Tax=Thiohalospira halophila DSM 15071 TaxID=1123397 RepID=A0A1I1P413_9GAMM|nr:autotransporter assembly complex family protein [Thiohalospira halophila]SFD00690.1 autotransporter secretion outer membrane protein TamA [Thiohalospira halophila DSM 15071]
MSRRRPALSTLCCTLAIGVGVIAMVQPGLAAVEIRVEGLEKSTLHDAVIARLPLQRYRDDPGLSPADIRHLHGRGTAAIRTALAPYGYTDPTIDSDLEALEGDDWRATYRVDPGEPVRVHSVTIELTGPAADHPELVEWREAYPLAVGDRLDHAAHDAARDRLEALGRELGLFEGAFEQRRIEVDREAGTADIALHYRTGPRYRFGAFDFSGSSLGTDLIRRFAPMDPGDPYHGDQLIELQRTLLDSDYFSRVEVIPHPREDEPVVDLQVELTDNLPTRYTAGGGYGTDTGPRVRGGIERRYLNAAGHRTGVEAQVSAISREAAAWYRIPLADPRREELAGRASLDETRTDTSEHTREQLRLALTRVPGRWSRTISLGLERERYRVADERDQSLLLMPGIQWQRTQVHYTGGRAHGWRAEFSLRGASEAVVSDTDLVRGDLQAGWVLPVTERHRLRLRSRLGGTALAQTEDLPASLRYFAGGDRTLRGFGYQRLGPTDDQGDVTGGSALAVVGVDYEHALGESFSLAVFHDAGNAYDPDAAEFRRSAGAGLRWRLPIGTLAVDFARAVDTEAGWRFHLYLRPDP